jgi:hypothetical protein
MSEANGARPGLVFDEDGLIMRLACCPSCGALVREDLTGPHQATHEQTTRVLEILEAVKTALTCLAAQQQRFTATQQWAAELIACTSRLVGTVTADKPEPGRPGDRLLARSRR